MNYHLMPHIAKLIRMSSLQHKKPDYRIPIRTLSILGSEINEVCLRATKVNAHTAICFEGISNFSAAAIQPIIYSSFRRLNLALPKNGWNIHVSPETNHMNCKSLALTTVITILVELDIIPENREEEIYVFGEISETGNIFPVAGILPFLSERLDTPILALTASQCAGEADLLRNVSVTSSNDLMHLISSTRSHPVPEATSTTENLAKFFSKNDNITQLKLQYRGLNNQAYSSTLRAKPNEFLYTVNVDQINHS